MNEKKKNKSSQVSGLQHSSERDRKIEIEEEEEEKIEQMQSFIAKQYLSINRSINRIQTIK